MPIMKLWSIAISNISSGFDCEKLTLPDHSNRGTINNIYDETVSIEKLMTAAGENTTQTLNSWKDYKNVRKF